MTAAEQRDRQRAIDDPAVLTRAAAIVRRALARQATASGRRVPTPGGPR